MVKVSVIIPVYNSEQYLSRCLDSAIEQTLSDLEIICIDDCSTDDSKILLEKYAEKDRRIKLLWNNRNMGQAFSRNRALKVAVGEYIQFLDSDDCLYGEEALELQYVISIKNRLDLCKSRYILMEAGIEKKALPYPESIVRNICSGKELLYQLEKYNVCAWSTWINFVRRRFLIENGINFYNGIIHEDVLYSYDLLYFAERAMCINEYTYFYEKHANSTTTKPKDISHVRGYFVCMDEIVKKNFMHASIEFRYATIKYFMRMYNNVLGIQKKMGCSINPEMLDDASKTVYQLFWKNTLINMETLIQNLSTIVRSEHICIYGAGKAARELLEVLDEYNIPIDGVFVTDKEKSPKTLMGHRVFNIEECSFNNIRALFLVAITKTYVGDVVDLLHIKGYENVIYVC